MELSFFCLPKHLATKHKKNESEHGENFFPGKGFYVHVLFSKAGIVKSPVFGSAFEFRVFYSVVDCAES